ncbi:ethanolaminephosphotransferase 1-like isoform X2 [Trachemys scripta elegans]|uniref:ethanolaminephosphotransferase 1-like isoform X2 n=1 Tax=Trachemys scripta elegans TaxID=31138 RepID=UPI0015548492|nr:ethanolaminephosphotransferase 1-like isoform X2 [Trachemys scripta elegans]
MWQPQYVTAHQRAGFRRYQYSAVDTNPLSVYVMQPLWNRIVKIVPLWIAPNLLTFSGFLMILINYFLLSFYDWDYTASGASPGIVPTWVWLFGACTTFCAYALDSIDGKHARRTQSSSPLGELFDHGLDSWATSIFILSYFSICSRDNGKTGTSVHTMYISLSIVLLNFMFSHWEKYNTGVLFLPWGYDLSQVLSSSGGLLTRLQGELFQKPDPRQDLDDQLYCRHTFGLPIKVHSAWQTLIAMYLVTAAVGVEVWHKPFLFGYYITDILVILLIGCSIFLSLPQTLYNIHKAHLKKTLKKDSLYEGLLPLVSPVLLFALLTIWVILSPCDILAKQTRLFLWMVGVVFSNVICRVIICQMSDTRSEAFHWLLFPLALVIYAAVTGLLGKNEEMALTIFTMLATAAHVHYGVWVGRQLSKHFNIYIFSLKKHIQA